jgi:hypothetical protein
MESRINYVLFSEKKIPKNFGEIFLKSLWTFYPDRSYPILRYRNNCVQVVNLPGSSSQEDVIALLEDLNKVTTVLYDTSLVSRRQRN